MPLKLLSACRQRVALLCVLAPILASCAGLTTSRDRIEPACVALAPILWSARDTDETLRQIKAHNAAWVALCGKP